MKDQLLVGLLVQLEKHCIGIGFKSRTGLNFFQAFFSLLLKVVFITAKIGFIFKSVLS